MRVSLYRRLLIILITLIMLVWALSVLVTIVHSRSIVLNQIDERLQRYADMASHTILMVLSDPQIEAHFAASASDVNQDTRAIITAMPSNKEQAVNLWFGLDSHILLGQDSPKFPSPPPHDGLETVEVIQGGDATEWRVIYRQLPGHEVWLAVGVDLDHARRNGAATFWQVSLPLIVVMPLTAILLVMGVGRGLVPLRRLADSIAARKPYALTPIEATDVPRELDPVVDALNELLERLQRALASESRFTANAAHELQTPLAAIKAEVQRCLRLENDRETREMLRRIDDRVRRSTETVSQLLTLARLDPDQTFQQTRFDLGELLMEVIADEADLALRRGLELDLQLDDEVFLKGQAEWMRILLRNLVLNAFKYADAGSEVSLVLTQSQEEVTLSISNLCSPLPAAVFDQLGERFYRPEGQRATGVGLGLSIARRIAALHNGSLKVHPKDENGGFSATLRFN